MQELFELPLGAEALRGVVPVWELPPAIAIGESMMPGRATLLVRNDSARPITVVLRGLERHRVSVAAHSTEELDVWPGEYVEAVHDDATTIPYFGIVQITQPTSYAQSFNVRKSGTAD